MLTSNKLVDLQGKMRISRYTRNATITWFIVTIAIFLLLGLSQEKWVDVPVRKVDDLRWRISMTFAYSSMFLLTIAMSIGPYQFAVYTPKSAT